MKISPSSDCKGRILNYCAGPAACETRSVAGPQPLGGLQAGSGKVHDPLNPSRTQVQEIVTP